MPVLTCLMPTQLHLQNVSSFATLFSRIYPLITLVKRVHWLRARAQLHRWQEELSLVQYEMVWTVRYFIHKHRQWEAAQVFPRADYSPYLAESIAYANRQALMWHRLGLIADKAFRNTYHNYKSPL